MAKKKSRKCHSHDTPPITIFKFKIVALIFIKAEIRTLNPNGVAGSETENYRFIGYQMSKTMPTYG